MLPESAALLIPPRVHCTLCALLLLHVTVLPSPLSIEEGLTETEHVGAVGFVVTVTVVLHETLPPLPVKVPVYVYVPAFASVNVCEPAVAVELIPPVNDADVAFSEDQLTVLLLPGAILLGEAVIAHVGAGGAAVTVTLSLHVTLPPAPVNRAV